MKNLRLVWLILIVAVLTACSSAPKTAQAARETVSGVALITAQRLTVPDWLEAVGTVHAAQTTQLTAQMMGSVVAINAREGDRVRQGQLLVVLDDAQPRAAVDRAQAAVLAADKDAVAAEADYTLADSTLKRFQSLWEKKSVSPQEFDEIKARFQAAAARRDLSHAGQQQARALLAQAQTQLDYAHIRSPFDGVVTEKKVELGVVAAPGMPLLTVEDTRRYRLEATVDESEIRYVKPSATVPVLLDSTAAPLTGKVVQLVPAADPASRSFVVKIDLAAEAQLHSGLFGRARFSRGERQALIVPPTAVVTRGQLQGVYAVGNDNVAALRYVTLGRGDKTGAEILSGLDGGERLVADPGVRDLGGKVIQP